MVFALLFVVGIAVVVIVIATVVCICYFFHFVFSAHIRLSRIRSDQPYGRRRRRRMSKYCKSREEERNTKQTTQFPQQPSRYAPLALCWSQNNNTIIINNNLSLGWPSADQKIKWIKNVYMMRTERKNGDDDASKIFN